MPNQEAIGIKLKTGFESVEDTGKILTEFRTAENLDQMFAIIANQNNGVCHGWLIAWTQIPQQAEGTNDCEVDVTYRFKLGAFYPYKHKREDGSTSDKKFRLMVEAVNDWLNENRGLGFQVEGHSDRYVNHQFLQSQSDFIVAVWSQGENAIRTHFAEFILDVVVTRVY